jgi:hypothetical protein
VNVRYKPHPATYLIFMFEVDAQLTCLKGILNVYDYGGIAVDYYLLYDITAGLSKGSG